MKHRKPGDGLNNVNKYQPLIRKKAPNILHRVKYKLKDFTVKTEYSIGLFQIFVKEEKATAESFCPELYWKAMLAGKIYHSKCKGRKTVFYRSSLA